MGQKARKNFFWGGSKAKAPVEPSYMISYELWVDGLPRRGSKKLNASEVRAWYYGELEKPNVQGLRIKDVSGGSMKDIGNLVGKEWDALNNPEVPWNRAFNNPDRYQIPSTWPEQYWEWGPQPRLAQWTGYPEYSYAQFSRDNPSTEIVEVVVVSPTGHTTAHREMSEDAARAFLLAEWSKRHDSDEWLFGFQRPDSTGEFLYRKAGTRKPYWEDVVARANPSARKNFFWSSAPAFPEFVVLMPDRSERRISSQAGWEKLKADMGSGVYGFKKAGMMWGTPYFRLDVSGEPVGEWLAAQSVKANPPVVVYQWDGPPPKFLTSAHPNFKSAMAEAKRRLGPPSRFHYVRENPYGQSDFDAEAVPWNTATNAGPFLPSMFPFGQGGRPAEYDFVAHEAQKNPAASSVEYAIRSGSDRQLEGDVTWFSGKVSAARAAGDEWGIVWWQDRLDVAQDEIRRRKESGVWKERKRAKKNPKHRKGAEMEIVTCRGVYGPHMVRRKDLFGQAAGELVCLRCYNESLPQLPQYGKKNSQYRMRAAQMRQKLAQLDKLYQYGQIDDETYHRLRSEMVVEPSVRHGETIGSKLRGLEERVGDRAYFEKYYAGRLGAAPAEVLRLAQSIEAEEQRIRERTAKGLAMRALSEGNWQKAEEILSSPFVARLGRKKWVQDAKKEVSRHRIRSKKALRKPPKITGPHRKEIERLRAEQLSEERGFPLIEGGVGVDVPAEPEPHMGWYTEQEREDPFASFMYPEGDPSREGLHPKAMDNPSQDDILKALMRAIYETVEEAGPQGAPESPIYMAMEQRGIPFAVTQQLVNGLIREGYLTRQADVLYTTRARATARVRVKAKGNRGLKAKKNRSYVGSGARGGFVGGERASLPNWYFLKPSSRGWPAGDPRKGARDDMHAMEVIRYMNRGFGNRSEYPSLIKELATRYPVEDSANRGIWSLYRQRRDAIDEKMSDRGVSRELPTVKELREREVARSNRRKK